MVMFSSSTSGSMGFSFTVPLTCGVFMRMGVNLAPLQRRLDELGKTLSIGALILVAGKLREGDPLQAHIHNVTDRINRLFLGHGYTADRIYYLATDPALLDHCVVAHVSAEPGHRAASTRSTPRTPSAHQAASSSRVGRR